ncbi:hypothetical protein ACLBXM_12625 [Xanthobacteraceae bacterium A53D]
MTPDMAATQGAATQGSDAATFRLRRLGAAVALASTLALAGCAGDSPASFLDPHVPEVPKVDPAAFPTVGAPEVKRRATLTPDAQAKLQRDLEVLSRDKGKSVERAIQQKGI